MKNLFAGMTLADIGTFGAALVFIEYANQLVVPVTRRSGWMGAVYKGAVGIGAAWALKRWKVVSQKTSNMIALAAISHALIDLTAGVVDLLPKPFQPILTPVLGETIYNPYTGVNETIYPGLGETIYSGLGETMYPALSGPSDLPSHLSGPSDLPSHLSGYADMPGHLSGSLGGMPSHLAG